MSRSDRGLDNIWSVCNNAIEITARNLGWLFYCPHLDLLAHLVHLIDKPFRHQTAEIDVVSRYPVPGSDFSHVEWPDKQKFLQSDRRIHYVESFQDYVIE